MVQDNATAFHISPAPGIEPKTHYRISAQWYIPLGHADRLCYVMLRSAGYVIFAILCDIPILPQTL